MSCYRCNSGMIPEKVGDKLLHITSGCAEECIREERPNHQVYDKCLICGGKFKAGDSITFTTSNKEICKNCASLERERRVPKL